MIDILAAAPQELQVVKAQIMEATGLGKDALHIYAGLAVFLAIRLLWRWRGGWVLAWITALTIAAGVEWLDMQALLAMSAISPDGEHWHDVWNTMFWPTILLLIGPWLQPRRKMAEAPTTDSGDLADQPFEQPPAV